MTNDFWGGAFAPIRKHRDYEHPTFFAHMLDNGGGYQMAEPVDVKYSPIDASPHFPADRYYFVDFYFPRSHDFEPEPEPDLTSGRYDVYTFLIHSEPDLSEPNEKRIEEEFSATCADPLVGGRDWWDYLDFDSPLTLSSLRVQARLEEEEPPMGPPRQRRKGEDDEDA